MSTPAHFQHLFDYELRCTDLVITSLCAAKRNIEDLSLASMAAPYERAVAIFSHVQAARRVWLHRVEPPLTSFPPDGIFPIWPLDKAEVEAHELDALWAGWCERLPTMDLARPVKYTSTEGIAYESLLGDILTHVVNHSSYHRGQIASLVASCGVKPAVTDYVALTRKKL